MESMRPGFTARVAGIIAVAGLMAFAGAAGAGDFRLRPGMTGVADFGTVGCKAFNEMYPAGPVGFRQSVLYWFEGFVYGRSGRNLDQALSASTAEGSGWDFFSLTGHIVDYCADNPEASVPDAAENLWQALQ